MSGNHSSSKLQGANLCKGHEPLEASLQKTLATARVRKAAISVLLLCGVALSSFTPAAAQVATGGGGEARPDQYVAPLPEYTSDAQRLLDHKEDKKLHALVYSKWRSEIRKQLFLPQQMPALQAHVWSSFSPMPGVIADRVTYSTEYGMRVPAIVYRPDPKVHPWKGKLPGVVIVNGHGGDKFSWYAFYSGLLFARAGAVAVTYDPLGEGERNARRASRENPSPHDAVVDLPHWGQRLAGLMQVDLSQAISYLEAQPQVDKHRIAVVGYSMGAFISGIAGAIDTRIHAVVLSGGGTYDGPHEYFDTGKLPCQAPPYRALNVLGDRSAILYALNADRGPLFVMNGDADTVMKMSEHPPAWFTSVKEHAAALRGSNDGLFETILYPGISHRTGWVNLDAMLWLNKQIHFGLWSDEDLRKAGTTHISKWIKENGVDISPNYIREDREGGLDAVGQGFPGIPRKDLMVLSDDEWKKEEQSLIYEGWAAKTKALEATTPQGKN